MLVYTRWARTCIRAHVLVCIRRMYARGCPKEAAFRTVPPVPPFLEARGQNGTSNNGEKGGGEVEKKGGGSVAKYDKYKCGFSPPPSIREATMAVASLKRGKVGGRTEKEEESGTCFAERETPLLHEIEERHIIFSLPYTSPEVRKATLVSLSSTRRIRSTLYIRVSSEKRWDGGGLSRRLGNIARGGEGREGGGSFHGELIT